MHSSLKSAARTIPDQPGRWRCLPASAASRSSSRVVRCRSNNPDVELLKLHDDLIKEIEERKRAQAELLKKLNNLSVKAAVVPANKPLAARATPSLARTPPAARAAPPPVASPPATARPTTPSSMARTPPPPVKAAPPPVLERATPAPPTPPPVSAPPPTRSSPLAKQVFKPAFPRTSAATIAPPAKPPTSAPQLPQAMYTAPKTSPGPSWMNEIPLHKVVSPPVQEEKVSEPEAKDPGPPLAGENVMNVVMVGAECAPWSKTGGLGDVMSALPKGLARRGHRVMVVAPRYEIYDDAWETGVRMKYHMFGSDQEVGYFHSFRDGVDYVFVDHPCYHGRKGGDIYKGERVELLFRCALLCKAALEAVWHVPCGGVPYGDNNCVFIANDWHTALLPVFLQAHYRDYNKMTYSRCIFVIHNMAHQGRGPFVETSNLELSDDYKEVMRLYDPIGGEHMNVLKAGLQFAHRIVAVSQGYAWECQTQEGGWGLDAIIKENNWKLRGIVNGIDYMEWSPMNDEHLDSDGYTRYSIDNWREGKRQCKAALQRELGLPVNPDVPLLGFIGRLDYQKGVDLIRDNYDWITGQNCQLVLLGSGRDDLESALRDMENRSKDKCRAWVGFSTKMAHRITAGIDILLMPSRFEPCGLNQLYAMAYGSIPVVHAVGGLRDTVTPFNPFENTGTGWLFDRAEAPRLLDALNNAITTYRQHRDSFDQVAERGMQQDLSWDNAAAQYEEVLVAAKFQW